MRIDYGYGFSQLALSVSAFPELPQQLELHAFSILPCAEIYTSAHTTPTSHWLAGHFHLPSGCKLQTIFCPSLFPEMWILDYSRGCSWQDSQFRRNTMPRRVRSAALTREGYGLWLITLSNSLGMIQQEPYSFMLARKDIRHIMQHVRRITVPSSRTVIQRFFFPLHFETNCWKNA